MANAAYDKYEPLAGGFRARLAAPLPLTNGGFIGAVSLNASGRVTPGTGGQSGVVGVLVKNVAKGPVGSWGTDLGGGTPNPNAPIGNRAGDQVDIMTNGEVVNLDPTAFPAGSKVYAAAADGALSTTGGAGTVLIGFTVEAGRLVVRLAQPSVAQA
jgi:hypothetical protein